MRPSRFALLLAASLLGTWACGSPSAPSAEPQSFSSTVSFGFCLPSSYCTSRLEIAAGRVVFTYESRERPPLRQSRELQPVEWRRLVAAVDAARLRSLPSVIGCPDCADGGAESLTVGFANGQSTTVTFEYNRDVPGIEPLVAQVRAIRQSFGGYPGDLPMPEVIS
jgi:hypothetical protein